MVPFPTPNPPTPPNAGDVWDPFSGAWKPSGAGGSTGSATPTSAAASSGPAQGAPQTPPKPRSTLKGLGTNVPVSDVMDPFSRQVKDPVTGKVTTKINWPAIGRQFVPFTENSFFMGEHGVGRNMLEHVFGHLKGGPLESAGKPMSAKRKFVYGTIATGAPSLYAFLHGKSDRDANSAKSEERATALAEALKASRGTLIRSAVEPFSDAGLAQVLRNNPDMQGPYDVLNSGKFPEGYAGTTFGKPGSSEDDLLSVQGALAVKLLKGEADPARVWNDLSEMMSLKDAETIKKDRMQPGPDGKPTGKSKHKPWDASVAWLPVNVSVGEITGKADDKRNLSVGLYRPKGGGPARVFYEGTGEGWKKPFAGIDKFEEKPETENK